MSFSVIPFLFALQIFAIWLAIRHAKNKVGSFKAGWIYVMLGSLVIWGLLTTKMALKGAYISADFLAAYPTFWLPFIPVIILMIPLMLFKGARKTLGAMIDAAPIKWLIGIHTLRVLALGTLIKAYGGTFSMSFAFWVGIPDLLFGISALPMLWLAAKKRVNDTLLLIWNAVGVLVIIPGAPIIGQMGLPGKFHAIDETPSMVTLYEFPMVLAPSLVVPLFVAMNMFVAIRLIERRFGR